MRLNYNSRNAKLIRWFYGISRPYKMPSTKCDLIIKCIVMYIFIIPACLFSSIGMLFNIISKDKDSPSFLNDAFRTSKIIFVSGLLYLAYMPINVLFISGLNKVSNDYAHISSIGIFAWAIIIYMIIPHYKKYIDSNKCKQVDWYVKMDNHIKGN